MVVYRRGAFEASKEINVTTVLLTGSFDPITLGHLELIKNSVLMFEKVIIAIGENPDKKYLFSLEERIALVKKGLEEADLAGIPVLESKGLTVNFARKVGAKVLVRGVRQSHDIAFELQLAAINQRLAPDILTVFMPTSASLSMICSSFVKDVARYGGDLSLLVPNCVCRAFEEINGNRK